MIVGALTSFSGRVSLTAGQSFTEERASYETLQAGWNDIFLGSHRGFEVRLDDFKVVYGEDSLPRDFVSTVTIIEEGEEVLTEDIRVNDPLEYQGVKIYQSTYGWAAKVKIEGSSGDVLLDSTINCQLISTSGVGVGLLSMSGTSISMEFIVVPDQTTEGSMVSLSPLPNNPALFFILLYEDSMMVAEDIALGKSAEVGDLIISFEELELYSGLEANSKPELPVLCSGSIMFILGLIPNFYMRRTG